jgi:hypothetical protein
LPSLADRLLGIRLPLARHREEASMPAHNAEKFTVVLDAVEPPELSHHVCDSKPAKPKHRKEHGRSTVGNRGLRVPQAKRYAFRRS